MVIRYIDPARAHWVYHWLTCKCWVCLDVKTGFFEDWIG